MSLTGRFNVIVIRLDGFKLRENNGILKKTAVSKRTEQVRIWG